MNDDIDVTFVIGGSITLLSLSPAAKEWVEKHVTGDVTWHWGYLVVEFNYLGPLLCGMRKAGLVIAGR